MGRWGTKPIINNCLRLNMKRLREIGTTTSNGWKSIAWGEGEDRAKINVFSRATDEQPSLQMSYKIRPRGETDWTDCDYTINLERTPCNFGGSRLWFRCPRCERRSAMLYSHGNKFICRRCGGFCYESQNENRRGMWGLMGVVYDNEKRAEKLYEGKRWQTHYNGQPTKRYMRHVWYTHISNKNGALWLQLEENRPHQRAKTGLF